VVTEYRGNKVQGFRHEAEKFTESICRPARIRTADSIGTANLGLDDAYRPGRAPRSQDGNRSAVPDAVGHQLRTVFVDKSTTPTTFWSVATTTTAS